MCMMPINGVEVPFKCLKCGHEFKAKTGLFESTPRCPKCKSKNCIMLVVF